MDDADRFVEAIKKEPKLKPIERGFSRIDFVDIYGQKCSLQKSSSAMHDNIWLGVDYGIEGEKINGRMHLNQALAAQLIPLLEHFVKTGEVR